MNIDLAALRALAQEREIPVETILAAIETALLTAYRHTEGAHPHARVEIDRKTGVATVYAQELDADGSVVREWDDTPHDFGRIAAMTAKQVILQRLREADRRGALRRVRRARRRPGHRRDPGAREPRPRRASSASTSASSRRCCRRPSRCPARRTSTASGSSASSCTWPRASAGRR